MKRIVIGLAAALVSAGAVVAASQPPEAVRQAVATSFADARNATEHGAEDSDIVYQATPAMFSRVNVNGDGIPDWRVDFSKAHNPSFFCGTGGCRQQIYISRPQGAYQRAFDSVVGVFRLKRVKGEGLLDVNFHGSVCGGYGVDPCPRRYGWSDAAGQFIEQPGPGGRTFLIGGPTAVPLPPESALPAPVREAIVARQAACKAAGGTYPYADAYAVTVADLNADGQRDWVVGGGYDGCTFTETPETPPKFPATVYVSGPGGFTAAWGQRDVVWGLDLAGGRGTFVTLAGAETCGLDGKDCQKTRWRWNGTALVSDPVAGS